MSAQQTEAFLATPTLAVSPAEAARLVGIGKTKLYDALGDGSLRSLKIGSRRLVMVEDLHAWLIAHHTRA